MKCENCGKYDATFTDYRTIDGITGKVFHCVFCNGLDDVSLYKIRAEGIDPIDYYVEDFAIDDQSIEHINIVRDNLYERLEKALDAIDLLKHFELFLECERKLTLAEEQPK